MVLDQNDRLFPYLGLPATRGPFRLPQLPPPKPMVSNRSVNARKKQSTGGLQIQKGLGGGYRGGGYRGGPIATRPVMFGIDEDLPIPRGYPFPEGFAQGGSVEYIDPGTSEEESDEDKRRREAAAVPVPPAPAPVYGPPVPTYQENVQAVAARMTPQELEQAAVTAAGELTASDYYNRYAPVLRDIAVAQAGANEAQAYFPQASRAGPSMVQTQAGREDIPLGTEGTLRGQRMGVTPRTDTVATVPQGYTESPLVTAARVAQGPAQVAGGLYEAANVDIPLVSPAARWAAPYLAEGINAGSAYNQIINRALDVAGVPDAVRMPSPFLIPNLIAKQVGAPSVGKAATDLTVGSGGAVDLGLIFAPGIGDIPITSIAPRVGAAPGALREALAESATRGLTLRPGVDASLTPAQRLATRGVGVPAGAALDPNEARAIRAQLDEAGITGWQTRQELTDALGAPDALARAKAYLEATGQSTSGTPSRVWSRYEGIGAQLYPETSTPAQRIANEARLAYEGRLESTGGPTQGTLDAARRAAAGQQGAERTAAMFDETAQQMQDATAAVRGGETELERQLRESVETRRPGVRAPEPPAVTPTGNPQLDDTRAALLQEQADEQLLLPQRTATQGSIQPATSETVAGPGFTMTEGRTGVPESRGQRIDRLMREAAQAEPQYANVRELSTEDVLTQAQRLGVDVDEQALRRGTALTRDAELEKVQRALDAEFGTPRGSMAQAEEGTFDTFWGEEADRRIAETAAKVDRWQQQFAPQGAAKSNPVRAVADILYTPFSGDISSWLRQDVTRTLNPFRAGETVDVAKAVGTGLRSAGDYNRTMDALTNMPGVKAFTDAGGTVHLADWHGGNLIDRENLYASWMKDLPGISHGNRAYAMNVNARRLVGLENFINANPNATQAQLQTYANYLERVTGRGTLGELDQAAAAMGPLFTSLRFALSIPERAPYLLPWTRLADGSLEIFGPVWRNAVLDHAGFIGTGVATLALAEQAGLKVDWDSGKIWAGNSSFDIWGGASQYAQMVRQLASGEKNGVPYPALIEQRDDGTYRGTVAEFVRNKLGPIPGFLFFLGKTTGAADAVGLRNEANFLRPDYWDKGSFGIKGRAGEYLDKALSMITPLWIQDVAKAVRAAPEGQKLQAGLTAGPAAFLGVGVQSYPPRFAERERSQARNEIVFGDRDKTFGPDLARLIGPDETYAQLGSREKQMVNAQMAPGELERLRREAASSGNEMEKALLHQDAVRKDFAETFDKLQEAVWRGDIDPYTARQAAKQIENQMYEVIDSIKVPSPEGGDYKPSLIQQAESGYRNLYDAARKEDGTTDYDALRQLQLSYMEAIARQYGNEMAGRLALNVMPGANPNAHPVIQFYDTPEMRNAVSAYNRLPVEQKAGFRLENPERNALLYAGGYVRTLDSPDAVEAYKRYSQGVPQINFNVGFRQEGAVTYRNLAGYPDVTTYQNLPLDQRADFLRRHPDLNALLWKTGHTSHIYSLNAWEQVKP